MSSTMVSASSWPFVGGPASMAAPICSSVALPTPTRTAPLLKLRPRQARSLQLRQKLHDSGTFGPIFGRCTLPVAGSFRPQRGHVRTHSPHTNAGRSDRLAMIIGFSTDLLQRVQQTNPCTASKHGGHIHTAPVPLRPLASTNADVKPNSETPQFLQRRMHLRHTALPSLRS